MKHMNVIADAYKLRLIAAPHILPQHSFLVFQWLIQLGLLMSSKESTGQSHKLCPGGGIRQQSS